MRNLSNEQKAKMLENLRKGRERLNEKLTAEGKERKTYTIQRLYDCISKDDATIDKHVLDNLPPLNRETRIMFKCNCGQEKEKTFRMIDAHGAKCDDCQQVQAKERLKNTSIQKYGCDNPSQSKEVQDKVKQTNMKIFRTECSMQNLNVRAKVKETWNKKYKDGHPMKDEKVQAKMKQTYKDRTGYENPFANPEVIAQMKQTYKDKTGFEYSMQDPDVKDKVKQTNLKKRGVQCSLLDPEVEEKRRKTCQEKYQADYAYQNPIIKEKYKQTMKAKYGVENPSQNGKIAEKMLSSGLKRKDINTPSGKTISLQGYEPFAYSLLLKTYQESDIIHERSQVPEIWWTDDKNKKHRYFVDFYVPKDKLMIEVKSTWTYQVAQEQQKISRTKQACEQAGYNYECWIFDNKGNKI